MLADHPERLPAALKTHNVTAVMLGNDHVMDFGEDGLHRTINALDAEGIAHTGAGANRAEAQAAFTRSFTCNGQEFRLAVISALEYYPEFEEEFKYYAGDDRCGVNNIHIGRLAEQMQALRDDGYFVVFSPHWGDEYSFRSNQQRERCERIVQSGRPNLVVGHGSKMFGEVRMVNGTWTLFGIGNYIFGDTGAYERHQVPPYSLIARLQIEFGEYGWKPYLDIYPIVSDNEVTGYRPCLLSERQFEHFVECLRVNHYDQQYFSDNFRRCHDRNGLHLRLAL